MSEPEDNAAEEREEGIKYDYEVLEVRSDDGPGQNGVRVRYTPEFLECSELELFVPVPFHKCRDLEHAREIMDKKIRARAPAARWRNELAEDESGDTQSIGDELAGELGVENEPADEGRRAQRADVSESSGSEGVGSGADGDAEDEAPSDRESGAGETAAGAGPRLRRPRQRN